jgi:hypothetical protein
MCGFKKKARTIPLTHCGERRGRGCWGQVSGAALRFRRRWGECLLLSARRDLRGLHVCFGARLWQRVVLKSLPCHGDSDWDGYTEEHTADTTLPLDGERRKQAHRQSYRTPPASSLRLRRSEAEKRVLTPAINKYLASCLSAV